MVISHIIYEAIKTLIVLNAALMPYLVSIASLAGIAIFLFFGVDIVGLIQGAESSPTSLVGVEMNWTLS